jgi:hypothetical protein
LNLLEVVEVDSQIRWLEVQAAVLELDQERQAILLQPVLLKVTLAVTETVLGELPQHGQVAVVEPEVPEAMLMDQVVGVEALGHLVL